MRIRLFSILFILLLVQCKGNRELTGRSYPASSGDSLADSLEASLFRYIVDAWYPRCIDTLYGGYIPDFEYNWEMSDTDQDKALVHQARHLWTLSYLFENYPAEEQFLNYANQGFRFIREHFWDEESGGFYPECTREGVPLTESISYKRIYGQAFAVNGLAQFYKVSGNKEALELARETFYWMDENARDDYGGYFETLNRDGSPQMMNQPEISEPGDLPVKGLKEFNSSLHILEAFTELYRVWPDSLLRERLQEMYLLFRDVFIDPEGYLRLYFYPDWQLVPDPVMDSLSKGNYWFTQHVTYGHDVEAAFLLLEAAEALGRENDPKTQKLAKKLVDHSLQTGWDNEQGGFYYIGYKENGNTRIHVPHKAWWTEAEGLNALLIMHSLYPDDEMDYYGRFLQLWDYINLYLIDKKYGGWYNYGIDNYPENRYMKKSHNWKATYHNVRAMVRCAGGWEGRRGEGEKGRRGEGEKGRRGEGEKGMGGDERGWDAAEYVIRRELEKQNMVAGSCCQFNSEGLVGPHGRAAG